MNSQPIYSDVSAALTAARSRLIADAMQRQQRNKTIRAEYYGGGKDEEVVGDIVCSGSANSIVTRNHYGCLVLNAAHAMFIDVDDLSVQIRRLACSKLYAWERTCATCSTIFTLFLRLKLTKAFEFTAPPRDFASSPRRTSTTRRRRTRLN